MQRFQPDPTVQAALDHSGNPLTIRPPLIISFLDGEPIGTVARL